jgi:hypothetical protein
MKKVKISEAWNQNHGTYSVKTNRTDLDLGDMLKISEEIQIEAELDTIKNLEKMIEFKKQEIANIKDKYKRIRNKIAHDPKVEMLTDPDERKSFQDRVHRLGGSKKVLGCSIDQFRIFLDVQLEDGKSWLNWTNRDIENAWNVDHIREKQSGGSSHWSNFVPRDRKDNLNKGKLESALNHFASK